MSDKKMTKEQGIYNIIMPHCLLRRGKPDDKHKFCRAFKYYDCHYNLCVITKKIIEASPETRAEG